MAEEIKTAVEIVVALVAVVSAVQAHKSKVAAEAAAKRIETDQRLHEALRLALDVGVSQQVARHRLSALRRDYNTLFNAAGSYGGSAHKELQAQIDEHEKKLDAARETAAPFQGGLDRASQRRGAPSECSSTSAASRMNPACTSSSSASRRTAPDGAHAVGQLLQLDARARHGRRVNAQ